MGLIQLVIVLIFVGIVLWLIDQAPFISASFKPIIRWVIIAAVLLWLVSVFIGDFPLPRYHR